MGGASLGSAHAEITLDASGFAKGIAAAQSSLSGFSSATAGMAKNLSSSTSGFDDFATRAQAASSALDGVARTAGIFGGSIAAGLGAAAHEFIGFEASMRNVNSIAQLSEGEFAKLTDSVNELSTTTARGPTELADGLYDIVSSGFQAADAMTVLEAAANAATAGLTSTAVSSRAITQVLNAYGMGAEEAGRVSDVLFQTVKDGVVTFEELSTQIADVLPGAKSLGVSIEELGAAYATMTIQGASAAKSETQIEAIMRSAINPTKELQQAVEEYGASSASAIIQTEGLGGFIEFLGKASGGSQDELFKLLGTSEAYNGTLQLLTNNQKTYNSELENMKGATEGVGATQTALAEQTKTTAFALQQAKVAIQQAAQAVGGELAPAITAAAGVVQSLATAFSGLSEGTQSVAVGAVAAAGGLALLVAGTAKMVSFSLEAAANFSKLATVIRGSATAMSALSFAFSPAGLAVAGLAVGLGILISRHQDAARAAQEHKDKLDALADSLESFQSFITGLRFDGFEDAAVAAESLKGEVDAAAQSLELAANTNFEDSANSMDLWAQKAAYGTVNADELRARAEALTVAFPKMDAALRHPGVNVEKLAGVFNELTQELTRGDLTIEQFNAAVDDNASHLERFKGNTQDATKSADEFAKAQGEAAKQTDEAAKALENFQQQTYATAQASVEAISGFKDLVPIMDGVQGGFNKVGTSAERAILHMGKLGVVDLSPAERQALKLSENLNQVEVAITRTEGAIQQNASDMSMWAGRIQLVDDTLGTAEDGYKNLNKLVDDGKLSQQEANDILKDGIYLRERSVGGLEDEEAQQAKNISILADYVRAHDEAGQAVNDLSDEQRGFLTALQSTEGQTALATAQTVAYLSSLGLIPPEKVTEILADLGDSDPVIKALLEDLGLIPPKKEVEINATGDGDEKAKETKDAVDKIPPKKDTTINVDDGGGSTRARDVGTAIKEIPPKKDVEVTITTPPDPLANIPILGKAADAVEVKTKLGAPDTTAVDNATAEEKEVETKLATPDDSAVTGYKPTPINIPTKLEAPDTSLVTSYQPTTVHIPTQLDNPTDAPGVHQGPSTLTIPTVLGAPDASTLTAYTEVPLVVPVEFGPLPEVPQTDANAVTIPIEYGDLPEVPTDDIPTVHIPTQYDSPSWAEGASITNIPTVTIPTKYGPPSWPENVSITNIPTVVINTKYGTPPTPEIPDIPAVSIPFVADVSVVTTAISLVSLALGLFATTYTATLEATDNASGPIGDATTDGTTFATTYTATIDVIDNASGPIGSAKSAADGFVGTYTATLTADTSAATTAIAALAAMLPHSPAKEGPLAFQPSFDYVSDAFASSMDAMVREAHKSMSRVADSLNKDLAVGVMSSSTSAQRTLDALKVASITGGGGIIQKHTHYHDDRTFAPLDPDHYLDLLVSAKEGREAYKNIRTRSRYG